MKKNLMVAALILGASTMPVVASAADGKAVFEKSCKGCHSAMNPKFGDKAAWAPLVARGEADLVASVMKGKAPMPPKGGAANQDDVAAAVKYMLDAVK